MTSQRIGYIRVSSLDQNGERQLDGIHLEKVFTGKASGKDTNRPQLQAALNHIRGGDTLIVHSMDRLARNVKDMLRLVREMNDCGVSVQRQGNWSSLNGSKIARYAHAKQYKRMRSHLKKLKTLVGRVWRDVSRQLAKAPEHLKPKVADLLYKVERLLKQQPRTTTSCTACMPRKSSASEKAKRGSPMSLG